MGKIQCCIFALACVLSSAASAQLFEISGPVTSGKADDALLRSAPVIWNKSALDIAPGETIELPAFDGVLAAKALRSDGGSTSGILTGRHAGRFSLTQDKGAAVLSVHVDGGPWLRVSGATPVLEEFEPAKMPGCGAHTVPQVFSPRKVYGPESAIAPKGGDPVEIDVLVVYTDDARDRAGSTEAMEALIVNAADQANQAYINSGIDMQINLVHLAEVQYTEDSETALTLAKLTFPSDGALDEVHTLRDEHDADMVALIVRQGDVGGIGWILDSLNAGVAEQSFSITAYGNLGSMTFAHELGHNMGCDHDQQNITAEGYRLFNYSRGWRFTAADDSTLYRTIMSYSPGSRIDHFSNPEVNYNGTPTGVAIGLPDEAHCAQTINTSAPVLAMNRPALNEGEGGPGGEIEYEGFYCQALGEIYNNALLRLLLPDFATALFDLLNPPVADLNGGSNPDTLTFDGNGLLDCAYELGVLRRIIENTDLDLTATGGVEHGVIEAALAANRAQLVSDIGESNAAIVDGIAPGLLDIAAGYMTLGDDLSVGFVEALLDVVNDVQFIGFLNVESYARFPGLLSAVGDADGDGATNREEYDAYARFGSETYVNFALNPAIFPGGNPEGEGAGEGTEGGVTDGEGIAPEGEGEAVAVGGGEGGGEAGTEGEGDGGGEGAPTHTADTEGDGSISLPELLRVIQLFNAGEFYCAEGEDAEDGFQIVSGSQDCPYHDSDYAPADWRIQLSELLRLVQFFNLGRYRPCAATEDRFCAEPPV